MKCEICHQADAAKAIRREGADGEEDELYVCEACARAERQRRQRKSSRTRKVTGLNGGVEMSVTEISGDGEGGGEPPPIVGAILNAFQDMVNDLERASKGGEEKEKKDERKLVEMGADGADAAYRLRGGFHLEVLSRRNSVSGIIAAAADHRDGRPLPVLLPEPLQNYSCRKTGSP